MPPLPRTEEAAAATDGAAARVPALRLTLTLYGPRRIHNAPPQHWDKSRFLLPHIRNWRDHEHWIHSLTDLPLDSAEAAELCCLPCISLDER